MPTLVFCCGAECGNTTGGTAATGATKHWDTVNGTIAPVTAPTRGGRYAYKFTSAGAFARLMRTPATPTTVVMQAWVYFDTLPSVSVNSCFVGCVSTTGAQPVGIGYNQSSGKFQTVVGSTLADANTAVVVTGQWYQLDIAIDVHANPWTLDCKIDGVAQTQATKANAADNIALEGIGSALQALTVTSTVYVDDLSISHTLADYPLPISTVVGLRPNADGTHSFNAVTDFKYENTTNMPSTSPTDTWSHIDGLADVSQAEYLAAAGVAAGEYLEWRFEPLPVNCTTVTGVEVMGAYFAAGTAANKTTMRLVLGASTTDMVTDVDFSVGVGTACFSTNQFQTLPGAAGLTVTNVNALRARFASSYTTVDISPIPFISSLVLEVAVVPTAFAQGPVLQAVNRCAVI